MTEKPPFKAHLFICTHQRANGESCGAQGAELLRDAVKKIHKSHPEWGKQVRINGSGCLDRCEKGIATVIYPQGEWNCDLPSTSESADFLAMRVAQAVKNQS